MKKCANCGFEDENNSEACPQCAEQEDKKKRNTNFWKWSDRLLAAAGVWLIVSSTSIYVAWKNASNNNDFRWEQYVTRLELKSITDSIAAYRQQLGVSPKSPGDLAKFRNTFSAADMDHPTDAWGHTIVWSTNATDLSAISYGRDGKPGGIGLDYDLTTENPDPEEARPTFRQFLSEKSAKGMIFACLVCGSFAGMLSLLIVKVPELNRIVVMKLIFRLIVMVLAAIFMALIIAGLHIPVHEH